MSAGSLTGGVLSLKKLVIGGSTFTGGSGVSGLTSNPATGTTTANPVPLSATWATTGAVGSAPTAIWTTSAGGASLALVSPPLGGGSGITTLTGTGGTSATSASIAFDASAVASGASTALVFVPSASGMALTGTVASGGTGNMNATTATTGTPIAWVAGVYAPGEVVSSAGGLYICSATTVLADTAPAGNVPTQWNTLVAPSAGSGIAIARGTLVMNAQAGGGAGTVGRLSGVLGAGEVQLVAKSGTLPATVDTNNTWSLTWAVGEDTATPPNPVAPPAQACFAPIPPSGTGTSTTAVFNTSGAVLAGAKLNWVLY